PVSRLRWIRTGGRQHQDAVPGRLEFAEAAEQGQADPRPSFEQPGIGAPTLGHGVVPDLETAISRQPQARLAEIEGSLEPAAADGGKPWLARLLVHAVEEMRQPGGAVAEAGIPHSRGLRRPVARLEGQL